MEKRSSDPQNMNTLEESQSLEISTRKEAEETNIAENLEEEPKNNKIQTQSNALWQNPDRTIGKTTFKYTCYVI